MKKVKRHFYNTKGIEVNEQSREVVEGIECIKNSCISSILSINEIESLVMWIDFESRHWPIDTAEAIKSMSDTIKKTDRKNKGDIGTCVM